LKERKCAPVPRAAMGEGGNCRGVIVEKKNAIGGSKRWKEGGGGRKRDRSWGSFF